MADRWEVIEEDFQGVTGLEVIEECFYRDPGSDEDRRPAVDLGVNGDEVRIHEDSVRQSYKGAHRARGIVPLMPPTFSFHNAIFVRLTRERGLCVRFIYTPSAPVRSRADQPSL